MIMKTTVLFVFLFTFAFSSVNSSVSCASTGDFLFCSVDSTNSILIQETIASYFGSGDTYLSISVYTEGSTVLNITWSESMTYLSIDNLAEGETSIETYTVFSGVISISFGNSNVKVSQNNFFDFFPNLENFLRLNFKSIHFHFSRKIKFFLELKFLKRI